MLNAKTFGEQISSRRKELGLSQKQLADRLNITGMAISRIEHGAGLPDAALIEPLSNALNMDLDPVLGIIPEKQSMAAGFISRRQKHISFWILSLAGTLVLAILFVLSGFQGFGPALMRNIILPLSVLGALEFALFERSEKLALLPLLLGASLILSSGFDALMVTLLLGTEYLILVSAGRKISSRKTIR